MSISRTAKDSSWVPRRDEVAVSGRGERREREEQILRERPVSDDPKNGPACIARIAR